MSTYKNTILIADIFQLFNKGLRMAVTNVTNEYLFIGEVNTMVKLLEIIPIENPDILIISHRLLDGEVTTHLPVIKHCSPNTKILMLTMAASIDTLLDNIECVDALVFKDAEIEIILKALEMVVNGKRYISMP